MSSCVASGQLGATAIAALKIDRQFVIAAVLSLWLDRGSFPKSSFKIVGWRRFERHSIEEWSTLMAQKRGLTGDLLCDCSIQLKFED